MNEIDYLSGFYSNYDEDSRLTTKHGQVEFLTTMRYISQYLMNGMRVLEVGAATGRYSHALAKNGFQVDAVELIKHNIDIFKSKTTPDERISVRQGNAVDLSYFDNDTFDITLILGPMYHLFLKEDKLRALSEALRVTKKGGVLFISYCMSDAAIMDNCFKKGQLFRLISEGLLDQENFTVYSNPTHFFDLYRKEDIDELMSYFNVEHLHYVATDLASNFMPETIDQMSDAVYALYIKYHFSICERPDMVGLSHHSLDIFRKK